MVRNHKIKPTILLVGQNKKLFKLYCGGNIN